MPLDSSYNYGVLAAGENHIIMRPSPAPNVPMPGVMNIHGASGDAYIGLGWLNDGKQAIVNRMADAGYTQISADNGGPQTWGNSTATNMLTLGANKLLTYPNVVSGKVWLYGASMGGLNALNWARANPSRVQGIIMVIPVISPEDIRANNRTGYASLVNAAYGGSYVESTQGATRNPYTFRASAAISGIPMLIFYGLTDTTCIPSLTEAFAAADPTKRTLVPLSSGHDVDSYRSVNNQMIMDFMAANS